MGGRVRRAMERAPVHVVFSQSAGDLREALATLGRNEPVLELGDDLSVGPIDVTDHRPRWAWAREVLGIDAPGVYDVEQFWRTVTSLRGHVIAWMSRRDLRELCGLHELLWRLDDRVQVSVVDVADIEILGPDGLVAGGTSMAFLFVFPAMIAGQNLVGRAVPVTRVARAAYRAQWQRLRTEDAPLRVLASAGRIESAPSAYFDETVLACVTHEWQRCNRVIGESLNRTSPGFLRQTYNVDYLFSRLLRLIDEGRVEGRSGIEPWSMRESWARLPAHDS